MMVAMAGPMALEFKNLPPKEAIAAFERKGYTFGFDWQDVWQHEHATAFTVAKVSRLDILQDIRGAMDLAIKNGMTPQEFKKQLTPILQAKGWWGRKDQVDPSTGEVRNVQLGSGRRLQTIFDVNMRASYGAGKWERIQRTKSKRPNLRYFSVRDGRTRPQHRAWHGIVLPVDHEFWKSHYPPNGWRCRCTVQQLSDRDLERYGYELSPNPAIQTRKWVNKNTGEIHDVPVGIDPGFAYNVGEAAMRVPIDPAKYTLPAIGHESARQSVLQPDFEKFLKGQTDGTFPVGYVDDTLAKSIGATVRRVDLSRDTVLKQLDKHAELTVDDYRVLPDVMAFGRVVKDGNSTLAMHHRNGRLYYAVIKATKTGKAMFLSSFRLAKEADVARVTKRGELIRDWKEE
jgi:SPP1 gp7 family putative phage head morphogenesis protein